MKTVQVSIADEALANAVCTALEARGLVAAPIDDLNDIDCDLIVLTEGTTDEPIATRHWRVLQACQALRAKDVRIVLLGRRDHRELGSLSGLHGLSRTLRQEWPDVDIKTLDLVADCDAEQISDAILGNFEEGLCTPSGLLQMQVRPSSTNAVPELGAKALATVWLVSGGARGVTASCVIELARQVGGGTFLLAGRSAMTNWPDGVPLSGDLKTLRGALIKRAKTRGVKPTPAEIDREARSLLVGQEIRDTLEALAHAGVDAHYIVLDVTDMASVTSGVARLQQAYGPITGLVHGAGVLADALAIKKTKSDIDRVFGPKAEGLLHLLDALDINRLKYLALFSSASAVFGNAGQSDYAMANAWLNAVACQLSASHPDVVAKSFCWGPWAGGMVDDALAGHFAERGIQLIGLDEGAQIFARELLYGPKDEVELLVGDAWDA